MSTIYKVIYRDDNTSVNELLPKIFWDKDAAIKEAQELLKEVRRSYVYEEVADQDGAFRTTGMIFEGGYRSFFDYILNGSIYEDVQLNSVFLQRIGVYC